MPKPKSKDELLRASQDNYQKLLDLIRSIDLTDWERSFPPGTMNRNIRDVLAHLHQWHMLFLRWYEVGMNGNKPDMPAPGYTWKTVPALNRKIWKEYQEVDLKNVMLLFNDSYAQLQAVISEHSDQDLFEKRKYAWTGSTSLGAYLISSTSSHYDWAYKQIKKGTKQFKTIQ